MAWRLKWFRKPQVVGIESDPWLHVFNNLRDRALGPRHCHILSRVRLYGQRRDLRSPAYLLIDVSGDRNVLDSESLRFE